MRSSLKLCLSLAFFFLLLSASSFALTYITSCTSIIEPGEYVLANDIIDYSNTYICINIQADNVTLDCQGHTIDSFWWYYTHATTGIIINANNTTIKNCFLTDWTYALHTYGYYNNLINSTISNYESLIESSNGTIINVNVYGLQGAPPWAGRGYGIYVYGGFNTIINVSLDSCTQGLWIGGYNTLINITAKNNERGLLIEGDNNTIINSTFISNGRCGVRIDTFNNTIKNSKFLNNTRGIEFYGSSYNLLYNNLFDNNGVHVEILYGGRPYVNYWNTTLQLGPNIIGGPYIGGNYWGGYSDICNSTRINGICDDPYVFPYSVDYLPLSQNFTPITTTTTLPPITVIYEKGLPFPPLVILLMILFILIVIVGAALGLKRK